MSERDFKGVWIPKEIWFDDRLTITEKAIFAEIDSLDKNGQGCFASNEHLAEFSGLSKISISRIVSKLIDVGYIERGEFDGRQRILKSRLNKMISLPYQNDKAALTNCKGSLYIKNTVKDTVKDNKKKKKENGNKNAKTNFDVIVEDYTTNAELQTAIYEFIKMRKAIKSPMTDRALKQILNKLDTLASSDDQKIKILDQSIMNSWRGVFPLREDKQTKAKEQERQLSEAEKKLLHLFD